MRLKHWQGYGIVNATKISALNFNNVYGQKCCTLRVRVKGNHEWGIETEDTYTIFNWLVKRFDKRLTNPYAITDAKTNDYYVKDGGLNVEVCEYTISYHL